MVQPSDFLLGHTKIVDLLLKHNASVNNIGMKNMTALLAATKGGHDETALRLLEDQTIDIKVQDKVRWQECSSHFQLINFNRVNKHH